MNVAFTVRVMKLVATDTHEAVRTFPTPIPPWPRQLQWICCSYLTLAVTSCIH